jgi:DNA-binding FadR family transcriptional regulator
MAEFQTTAVHGVVADLRRKIDEGVYAEGQQIPPERVLAAEYGLARNTVRRALDALAGDGYLERHVGRGSFARRPGTARGEDGMLRRLREAGPADLMEFREILEPRAAALAASRAGAGDLAAIEEAYRHSVAARGLAEFEHWDGELHLAIAVATRNGLIADYARALNEVRAQPAWYQMKKRYLTPAHRSTYDRQHGDIVAALREHDGERAARAMRAHLAAIREMVVAAEPEVDGEPAG